MPSRIIRGEFNASESMARVSLEAELTFAKLILAVDDYGRIDARPKALRAALYPLRDEVTPEQVAAWVAELDADGCVKLYESNGRPYLQLTGWEEHRGKGKRGMASKCPAPNGKQPPRYTEEPKIPKESADPRGSHGDPSGGRGTGDGGRCSGDEGRVESGASAPPRTLDPTRLVNLLAKEAGDRASKLAWLDAELPLIEELAAREAEPGTRAFMAEARSRVIRHWRQHRRNPRDGPDPRRMTSQQLAEAASRLLGETTHGRASRDPGADVLRLRSGGDP